MARGSKPGERRGGRQKGTLNAKTAVRKAVVAQANAEGVTPLDVMLTLMRSLWADAVDSKGRVINVGKAMQANVVAKDAAPFLHPKLSNIQATGPDGGPIQVQDLSALSIEELHALKAIHGKLAVAGGD